MDVITMEATAYKELIRKIEKIADYVFKKESKPNEEEEIWLDNQEVANLLRISTKTTATIKKRKSNQLFHVTRKMQIQIIRNRKRTK